MNSDQKFNKGDLVIEQNNPFVERSEQQLGIVMNGAEAIEAARAVGFLFTVFVQWHNGGTGWEKPSDLKLVVKAKR
jgi:hypothetical protein